MAKRTAIHWIFLVVLCVNCTRQEKNTEVDSLTNVGTEALIPNGLATQTENAADGLNDKKQKTKMEVEPVEWKGVAETASAPVLSEFPRLAHEPENVDSQNLGGVEMDVISVDLDLVTKLDVFLDRFSREASDENMTLFLGAWILHDENDVRLGDYENIFDIQTTDIRMFEKDGYKTLTWRKQLNNADLYFADDGNIYMFPGAPGGMLGFFQLRLYGTKLYLYMLNKDKWILASEHEGGKKYYVKYPLREVVFLW